VQSPVASARRLRVPGYLIMGTLILLQLIEIELRSWPFRVHSPTWRLGLIGTAAGSLGTPLFGLLIILAIAVATDDRAAAYAVSFVSWLSMAACVASLGVFGLDVLQVKSDVASPLAGPYDVGSGWVAVRMLVAVLLFVVLAVSAWRAAKSAERHRALQEPIGRSALLVSPVRPATPVPPVAQTGVKLER
jgi:hypothetical protein